MSKRIYIGNLSYITTEETIEKLFSSYGQVLSATIIKDKDTSQSKGFGFVELDDDSDSDGAIAQLGGREVDGRRVRVNYAEEKKPQSFSRGGYRDRPRSDDGRRERSGRFAGRSERRERNSFSRDY